MIKPFTRLNVADNTGAKIAMCIRVPRCGKHQVARIGDLIHVTIKQALPNGTVKKKQVAKAVIVRQHAPWQRADGTSIKFDDNALVIVNPDKSPVGTRILGPVAREIKTKGYSKIASLAPEIL
ncbi:MAG: 50S ribosomal protein L14 [Patescibacteria group bacterium]|nr:50S ribosomal protein L14 [Patescibacteria group bacterium]